MTQANAAAQRRNPFSALFLQAHPSQALLEACMLGWAAVAGLFALRAGLRSTALTQGALFTGGGAALWCALRMRVPSQRISVRRMVCELLAAVTLGVLLAVGWWLLGRLGGVQPGSPNGGQTRNAVLFLLGSGPEFLVLRAGVTLWLIWTALCRRRLLWSLTHLQVQVVLLFATLAAVLFVIGLFVEGYLPSNTPQGSGLLKLADTLIFTIFPFFSVVAVSTLFILALVLPPTVLFAFLHSRRITQRLEALARAATHLRSGDYTARVGVQGEDEIAQLQADFNAMAEGLEQAMRDLESERDKVESLLQHRRELVASVSHELRTPVATMRGYLESIHAREPNGPTEGWTQDLQIVENELVRLQGLIEDLFTLSRAEASALALDVQPTDVGSLVHRRVEAVAPMAWRSGRVQVAAEIAPSLPPALADERRLDQVLINLLRNAIQHTMPGAVVVVAVCAEHEMLRIDVLDTGEGIPAQDLPHIWDRFYRGQSSQGAGLGLALVKELTEAMGGTVSVESVVGEGSRFTLRIPLA
jgi:signal transduction histidine kinase